MDVSDVKELHYITPMGNLPSIFQRGILSNYLVEKLPHSSVAKQEVQEIRASVRVPSGRPLHEYVNLYFNARNAMMYKRQSSTVRFAFSGSARMFYTLTELSLPTRMRLASIGAGAPSRTT